jgi:xylulokinase
MGEVPVVVGGADTALALLAAGTTAGVQVNLGSGVQLIRPGVAPAPAADPVVHCYADAGDGWYGMAALQNGGTAWTWVQEVLGLDWAGFVGSLSTAQPGAGGAVFTPFLTGERGGIAGPSARGGWTGLTADTTRADLARAALEGVAFAVAAALRLLGPVGDERVVVTGGGARDPRVLQLLADVLGRPVRRLPLRSASAVGAAMLAARGAGMDVLPAAPPEPPVEPRPGAPMAAAAERWAAG